MKLARHLRSCRTSGKLSRTFWQSRRLLKIVEKYFEAFEDISGLFKLQERCLGPSKNILKLSRCSRTCQTSRKLCWTLWQSRRPLKSMRLLFSTIHCLTNMRLVWPTWDCTNPHETTLTHMRLLCPLWDISVPHETALCYMRHISSTWDRSIPHEPDLSHMRLLCAKRDCPVPHETVLSHMRLPCPTWDCMTHMSSVLIKHNCLCNFFFFALSSLFWTYMFLSGQEWDGTWTGTGLERGLGRDWDGTGTGLGWDWVIGRTWTIAVLRYCKGKTSQEWSYIAHWVYVTQFWLHFLVWQCSSVSSTAAF